MLTRTILLIIAMWSVPCLAQQRIGHVDKQQLLLLLPDRKVAEDKVKRKAEELDGRIKAMMSEYESTIAKLSPEFDKMTPAEQAMAQRDVRQLEERIATARDQAEDDLETLQRELLAPMLKQVDAAIGDVATSNGYAYILDIGTGTVVFHGDSDDVTPLVKTKLGI